MGVEHRDWNEVAEATPARVRSWLATVQSDPGEGAADGGVGRDVLEGVRGDSDGFAFTRRLLDALLGDGDPFAAAMHLRELSQDLPPSMPPVERLAVRASGIASFGLPWAVLPMARKWLRSGVSHLVATAKLPRDPAQQAKFAELRALLGGEDRGAGGRGGEHATREALRPEIVLALGGDAVLGDAAAQREAQRLIALVALPEVAHVAVDVARLIPETIAGCWSLDRDAREGALRLREVLEAANEHGAAVTLESGDYRAALLAPQMLVLALAPGGARGPGSADDSADNGDADAGADDAEGSSVDDELRQLRVGVSLPAELPESLRAAQGLAQFSRSRVAAGARPLEIAVGIAGMAGQEQIESILGGLPVPTLETRAEQQAELLRVVAALLEAGDAVRVIAASEDAHLLAAVTLLAERLGAADSLALQLRAGTAPALEAAVAEHGFEVRRRLPLTTRREFDGAVGYLVALAAETSDADSTLAQSRALLAGEPEALDRGARMLAEAISLVCREAPASRRVQRRDAEWSDLAVDTAAFYRAPSETSAFDTGGLTAAVLRLSRADTGAISLEPAGPPVRVPVVSATGFANEPDSDGTRYENRVWVRGLLERADDAVAAHPESGGEDPEALIDSALAAGEPWRAQRSSERGTRIGWLALATASARDRLVSVLAAERGAPVRAIDAEVNGAIDAARYLGQLAPGLGAVRGARFAPDRLALVVVDAGVPLDLRAEAVLAALAAGSAVVLVVHPSSARSSAALIEEWRAAGLPNGVVSLAAAGDPRRPDDAASPSAPSSSPPDLEPHVALAARFAADARVDRALVLGRRSTAQSLLRRRPDLRIEGRFSGAGAVVIAPSADASLAVRHAVASAFGASHDDPRTARVLVLLGSAARSAMLRRQLADAVGSLPVGDTGEPGGSSEPGNGSEPGAGDPLSFALGPLLAPPDEAGLRALTELDSGERWLVQPQQLDEQGRLWRPGVRLCTSRDARFWADSVGMPVIGVIAAHTIDEAISLVDHLGDGAVAALHATDPNELLPWLERAQAASLVVGRPTVPARIERQPGGGWGAAGMGAAPLAGGPNRLVALGSWQLREGTASTTLHLRGLKPEVRVLIEASQPSIDFQRFDRVRRAALADSLAWRTQLGGVRDISGLGVERNLLRRWPVAAHVRLAEGGELAELVRVLAAGLTVGAPMTVSTGVVLPAAVAEILAVQGVSVSLERDDAWLERIAVSGPGDERLPVSRVRLIGGDRARTAEWLGGLGEVTLWAEPVTMAGPVELLAFLREQSVSIAAHRHGMALLPAGIDAWIAELQS